MIFSAVVAFFCKLLQAAMSKLQAARSTRIMTIINIEVVTRLWRILRNNNISA
jgi:hypothetical protein